MQKYVFVPYNITKDDEDITVKIDNWDDFFVQMGWDEDSYGPCYLIYYDGVGNEPDGAHIYDIMCWTSQQMENNGIHLLSVSVNSQEARFADWLQAASEFPEAQVLLTNKGEGVEYREIAFITWPSINHFMR